MAIEKVRKYFTELGVGDRILEFSVSSAGGAVIGFVLLTALEKTGVLRRAASSLGGKTGDARS